MMLSWLNLVKLKRTHTNANHNRISCNNPHRSQARLHTDCQRYSTKNVFHFFPTSINANSPGTLNDGLVVAFTAGAVMGFAVVGLGITGLCLTFIFMSATGNYVEIMQELAGFGFGASSIALFARVAGGIYTKAADVGADLVGKIEAGIDEDDPHNPAVIADNVGDNVGDVAGMGADLFESYVGSIIAACTLAVLDDDSSYMNARVSLPFSLAGVGIWASMAGYFFVNTEEAGDGWNSGGHYLMRRV